MKYFVYVGGVTLYSVTDVTETADRDIDVYDGVGQGNFPVGGSAGLRSWEISCELTELDDRPGQEWTSAKRIFKKLESFRESKDSQRLVITSDYGKTSVQALLESYSKTEKESGVYDVKIKLTEYKPVSKKTTNVPYVERPGKVPVAEKVVFHSATEVAADAIARAALNKPSSQTVEMLKARDAWARSHGESSASNLDYSYQWNENGQIKGTNNPNLVPTDTPVTVITKEPGPAYSQYVSTVGVGADYDAMADVRGTKDYSLAEKQRASTKSAFDAMSEAFQDWYKRASSK